MWPSVKASWMRTQAEWEGLVPYMYTDILGLITVGVGLLIDPIEYALALPFEHIDGRPASRAEIAFEWHVLKRDKERLAKQGHLAARKLTTLRLSLPNIEQLVLEKLAEMERQVLGRFTAMVEWPADAQFAVMSMSWAAGPGVFRVFPEFSAACRSLDFRAASKQCRLKDDTNPGLGPRNTGNRIALENAAIVLEYGMDPSVLHFPEAAIPPSRPTYESDAPPPPEPFGVPESLPPVPAMTEAVRGQVIGDVVDAYRKRRDEVD